MEIFALTEVDIAKLARLDQTADQLDLVAVAVIFHEHVKAAGFFVGLC